MLLGLLYVPYYQTKEHIDMMKDSLPFSYPDGWTGTTDSYLTVPFLTAAHGIGLFPCAPESQAPMFESA